MVGAARRPTSRRWAADVGVIRFCRRRVIRMGVPRSWHRTAIVYLLVLVCALVALYSVESLCPGPHCYRMESVERPRFITNFGRMMLNKMKSEHRAAEDEWTPKSEGVSGCAGGKPFKGIVSLNNAGRLGNVMSEYATLLGVNRTYKMEAWLVPDMARTLLHYFSNLSLPVLPAHCTIHWRLVSLRDFKRKKLFNNRDDNYMITDFPHDIRLFHPFREVILDDFTFRKKLRERADSILAEIASKARTERPVFIGVHVRRTDYSAWLMRRVRGHLVGSDYLTRAMALFRGQFPGSAVFAVTSDDTTWCRRTLRGPDVFVVGNQNTARPGADLALLAACNHTIVTHGTFGFWGGYLASGQVVMPERYSQKPTGLDREITQAGLGWLRLQAFVHS